MEQFTEKVRDSITRACEKVEQLRTETSLVFPIFTDLHTYDVSHEYVKKLTCCLTEITGQISCDAVVDLGDNLGMLGREIHITNADLKKRLQDIFGAVQGAINCPTIHVNGNHDAIGTDFFKPDFWNGIVKGNYGNTSAVYGEEGSYYYMDYEKANTRLVVLSLPYESDIESEMPTPLWGFGEKQIAWLKDCALDTRKNVIILSHVPFYYEYMGDTESTLGVWDGEHAKVSYISALCGWIEDRDEAMDAINAFCNRPDANLAVCLSGHMHDDSLWMPGEEKNGRTNPLPCKQIVTAATCLSVQGMERTYGISIDIAVWNPDENTIHMIRVGDGEDRSVAVND